MDEPTSTAAARPPQCASDPQAPEAVIPLVEEQAELEVHAVERGRVRINVAVEEREELVEAALRHEAAVVERVRIDRAVAQRPAVREEGDVLIVPLVEERLVVRTELVLTEELRITRRERTEQVSVPVRLRSERAVVARSEGSGPDAIDDKVGDTAGGRENPDRPL